MSNQLSIYIITNNSKVYLKNCFDSIFNQSYLRDCEKFNLLVIDNASTDGTVDWLKHNYPEVSALKNLHNIGLSKAWNQAIKLCKTEYILLANPDLYFDQNFVINAMTAISVNPKIGAVGGKLLKAQWSNDDLQMVEQTAIVDSAGLKLAKSRRVVDIGQGENDAGQFNNPCARFGVSGACLLLRMEALEDIKYIPENNVAKHEAGEYFDEDFFMYKEDFDLMYRLNLRGWQVFYQPTALCYHFRSASGNAKTKANLKIAANRLKKSAWINYNSYRNHLFVLYKNEIPKLFWRHLIPILWYEFRKIIFICFAEPRTLQAILEFFKLKKKMKAKRKYIQNNKKISYQDMEQWIQ
jgi:GT2 family glycosyltransferase